MKKINKNLSKFKQDKQNTYKYTPILIQSSNKPDTSYFSTSHISQINYLLYKHASGKYFPNSLSTNESICARVLPPSIFTPLEKSFQTQRESFFPAREILFDHYSPSFHHPSFFFLPPHFFSSSPFH